jgi:diguanylate cyclase (GGDEF)-like protein
MIAASASDPAKSDDVINPRDLLSSIGEVVYSWDIASDDLRWGPNAGDILGSVASEVLLKGLAFARLVEPGSGRSRYDAITESTGSDLGDGVVYRTRYAAALGGRSMWVEDTGRWFAGLDGRPASARGVLRLERAVREDELSSVAREFCDRIGLVEQLDASLGEHLPAKRTVAVLVATIDELSSLNDDLGHDATDEIITTVQDRLRTVMRGRDRLMRYSGSRFAVTLVGCPAGQLEAAARRFIRVVSRSAIETSRGIALVHLRVGAAHAPTLASNGSILLGAAEQALVEARSGAVETAVVATRTGKRDRQTVASDETQAVRSLNDRLVQLALQPVACAQKRIVRFHEALLRVAREDGRYFAPADLVPLLERRGLVQLFDNRVIELACQLLGAEPNAVLSINVSPRSLADPAWISAFVAQTGAARGVAERLIVEVTETATIDDPDGTVLTLKRIKNTGARIAIDDFGAGHTSMRHLRAFPIDILKLDGAFTQNLQRSTDDRFFVKTLIELARHLKVETVAEWVDDTIIADMLTDWGITYLQGHLIGEAKIRIAGAKPLPFAAAG